MIPKKPLAEIRGEHQDGIPWIAIFIISAVFFLTLHSVMHTRSYIGRGADAFIPTQQDLERLTAGWERGKLFQGIAYLVLGMLGVVGLLHRSHNKLQRNGWLSSAIILYIVVAYASLIWTNQKFITAKQLFIFTMVCLALSYAVRCFSDRDVAWLAILGLGTYFAIGLAAEIALGTFRPWMPGYRFSGTGHPNGTALELAVLFIACVTMAKDKQLRGILLPIAFLTLVALVLTKSRTSLAGAVLAPIVFGILTLRRYNKFVILLMLVTAACLFVLIGDALTPVLEKGALLGRRDTTIEQAKSLTGRTDLWHELLSNDFPKSPLLGYGFNSFWTVENVERVGRAVNFRATTAHSAYVDALIGLGPLGLAAYLFAYLFGIRRCVVYFNATRDPVHLFFGSILVYVLLHGTTESGFLFAGITTFVAMAILAKLGFQQPPEPVAAIENPPRGVNPLNPAPAAPTEAAGPPNT